MTIAVAIVVSVVIVVMVNQKERSLLTQSALFSLTA
jgi:hypothetical protein